MIMHSLKIVLCNKSVNACNTSLKAMGFDPVASASNTKSINKLNYILKLIVELIIYIIYSTKGWV